MRYVHTAGLIYTFSIYDQKDFKAVFSLPGYIHAISFNIDGSQLAVAFGDTCKVALMDQDENDFGKFIRPSLLQTQLSLFQSRLSDKFPTCRCTVVDHLYAACTSFLEVSSQ